MRSTNTVNRAQDAATLESMRLVMLGAPVAFAALGALLIVSYPLGGRSPDARSPGPCHELAQEPRGEAR